MSDLAANNRPIGQTLPPQQRKVLQFVQDYWEKHEQGPTGKEIAAMLGRSESVVVFHLRALREKGFLTRIPMGKRTLEATPLGRKRLVLDE